MRLWGVKAARLAPLTLSFSKTFCPNVNYDGLVGPLDDRSHGFSSQKSVGKHFECSGASFSDGSTERVDGRPDFDAFEAGLFEHLLPARTG